MGSWAPCPWVPIVRVEKVLVLVTSCFVFSFGLLPVFLPTGRIVWPSRHQQFDLPFISVAFVFSSTFLVIFRFFSFRIQLPSSWFILLLSVCLSVCDDCSVVYFPANRWNRSQVKVFDFSFEILHAPQR